MKLQLLHLDDGLTAQQGFLAACVAQQATITDARAQGRHFRLWGRQDDLDAFIPLLREALGNTQEPVLTFMGSGDFHHMTALLLQRLAETQTKPFTLVHFDNHPDWVHFSGGMHCGSWVNRALALPNLSKAITIGVCSKDLTWPECKGANLALLEKGRLELYPYSHAPSRVLRRYKPSASYRQRGGSLDWHTMELHGDDAFLELLLSRIDTEAIYITVDKDVLELSEVTTNWDQGKMRLPQLLGMIAALGEKFRVIGADVIGDYSPPVYDGTLWMKMKKRAEIMIDQPQRNLALTAAAAHNEPSNLALLDVLREVMA